MKRYDNLGSDLLMMPNGFGEWVKYEDVEKLVELNDKLLDENKVLKNEVERLENNVKRYRGSQTLYDSDFGRITGTQRPR